MFFKHNQQNRPHDLVENINAVLINDGVPQGERLVNSIRLPFSKCRC